MDILKKHPYFAQLEEKELIELNKLIISKDYKKNEILFFEGETGQGLHIVEKGKVKLVKSIESGEEQIINILKQGDIFAEVVLFDGGNYPATAITIEDAKVGIIQARDMQRLIYEMPNVGLKILKVMSERLRRAQKMIRNLGLKNTTSRTASILLTLAKDYGVEEGNNLQIDLSLTQQELANLIGTSRETISRTLNKFKDDKIITLSRQKITIKDLDSLKEKI
ncbi:Crp/Fnr family transcriptional regulator [Halonatronum saccharophilum]|uniref:Crp/Fnr family transcriptional regulator n=1 Tax=Halonatronum saccharophilum TaxID=150060 RepID=UPI00047F98E3|nr:Crp/Fnr family transcriptional regulator [Halonatronum saccharophilum]